MKKLMIAAATAAMVGGAFAALPDGNDTIDGTTTPVGIMHNVAITVKTLMPTVYDSTKTKGCPICAYTTGDTCYLFEQGTLKINGLFASCGCEDMFEHGYFWLGSGKKATRLFNALSKAAVGDYDTLPTADDMGITFAANRYGKTMKKVVVELDVDDGADVEFSGIGFGSYTDSKYKYNKDDDEYVLKSTAKVSASGSILGSVSVDKLKAYLVDQGTLTEAQAAEDFKVFPVDGGCTIELTCDEGDVADVVPVTGTFTIKPATAKAFTKVIPAACWVD